MQQIANWLEQLGMSEYAQRFAENDVDFAILPDLTDQDLENFGAPSTSFWGCKFWERKSVSWFGT